MKINSYMIASPLGRTSLSVVVENLINQGWQPHGYPYLDRTGVEKQAMVMYEDEPLRIVPRLEGEELDEIVHVKVSEVGSENYLNAQIRRESNED